MNLNQEQRNVSTQQQVQDESVGANSKQVNRLFDVNQDSLSDQNRKLKPGRTSQWMETRIQVALLGLAIAAVNCYAQATFCIAIVEMVIPADFLIKGETSARSMGVNSSSSSIGESLTIIEDHSCPIEHKYRDYYDSWRFQTSPGAQVPANGHTVGGIDVSNRFDWDASQQGLLLGAFAVGMGPLQVLGGRLAEIYGAKWVLLAGCIGTAISNITIPLLARFSFILLILNRIFMGVSQCGMEPGLVCLLAEWLTPAETGFFISMLLFAICVGCFLGSLCSSFILGLGYGWPMVYYVAGGMNLAMAVIWFMYASSRPRESKIISKEELEYIERMQQQQKQQVNKDLSNEKQWMKQDILNNATIITTIIPEKSSQSEAKIKTGAPPKPQKIPIPEQAPWMNIMSTPSVWAFIVCKISIRWCADVLSIELPTYLANVLHLSIKLNGVLNSVSTALFAIFSFITGYLVNEILKTQKVGPNGVEIFIKFAGCTWKMNKTTLRKTFQSVASFGSALTVFLMTQYDCNILFSMGMMLILSCCLVMGTGGELQIPYDMTSKYPGTLHGMACTLSISGWLAPPLIGLILGDQPSSRYRWSLVWYLTALIGFIGGLVFVFLADASARNFDSKKRAPSTQCQQKRSLDSTCETDCTAYRETGNKFTLHNQLQSDEHLGGYYNVACKSTDNTTPPLLPRTATTMKKLQQKQQPLYFDHNDDGFNDQDDCVAVSTRDGADSTSVRLGTSNYGAKGSETWNNEFGSNNLKSSSIRSKNNDLNWTPRFDREPIQIRQVEESFIKPRYLHNTDSVAGQTMIFPYRVKTQKVGSNGFAKQASSSKINPNSLSGASDGNQIDSAPMQLPSSHKSPLNLLRILWTRLTPMADGQEEFEFPSDCSMEDGNHQWRPRQRQQTAELNRSSGFNLADGHKGDQSFGIERPECEQPASASLNYGRRNYNQQMSSPPVAESVAGNGPSCGEDNRVDHGTSSPVPPASLSMVTTKTITHL